MLSGHLHTCPTERLGKHKYGQPPLFVEHSVIAKKKFFYNLFYI